MRIDFYKKKWFLFTVFSAIMIAAVFLRIYKLDDWLYFKMDQSRDAFVISNAVENGSEYLPLLGARVGALKLEHGFLRLGPAFYYFQYIAAKIAHSTEPYVFAYPDLFFSILTIPLLFLFVRIYFSRWHSLMIMAMYAFSFLIIQYSRFAWNPNSLQFFLPLSFLALLKFLDAEYGKKEKAWLALWAFAMAIGSQLHFFGFFSLLGISGLLIIFHLELWNKEFWKMYLKKESIYRFIKYFAIVAVVFTVIYTPVIISDVLEHGQNSKNFIEALGAKPSDKPFLEKIIKSFEENLSYYCLISTSECYRGGLMDNFILIVIVNIFILTGVIIAVKNAIKKEKGIKRNFIVLVLIWLAVFSVLTIPVAFQLRPRFFIVVFALPFIFLGFLYEFLEKRFGKKMIAVSFLITGIVVSLNLHGTYVWFSEQAKSQIKRVPVRRTLILKTKDGVTLGELKKVVDFIYEKHEPGKNIYYYVKPEHIRPVQYLLSQKKDPTLNFVTLKINKDPNAQFFAIVPNEKNGLVKVAKKYEKEFNIISSVKAGQIAAYEIDFIDRDVSVDFKFKNDGDSEDRYFWKDLKESRDDDSRFFWQDLFSSKK